MVVNKDGGQTQRFLAVDVYQMSLVEPETKRLGWGVVKFAGLLQVRKKYCSHLCMYMPAICTYVYVFKTNLTW